MAYQEALDALNLIYPDKLPRTEYSVQTYHWKLIQKVTDIDTTKEENRPLATREFMRRWDFGMQWNVLVSSREIEKAGGPVSKFGHAEYTQDGGDFDQNTYLAFDNPDEAIKLDPLKFKFFPEGELISRFEQNYQHEVDSYPDILCMSGIYISLFSGLIEIFGTDMMLMLLGLYPDELGEITARYSEWIGQYFRAFAKSNVPFMMVHDDLCWTSGPVASPAWYRKHIFPHLKRNIQVVKEAGKKVYFTSDGTIDEFFDDIVEMGVDSVVMEPSSNIRNFAKRHGKHCGMVGGIDCRTLTYGSRNDIESEVVSMIEFGKKYPGFMLACGNHLPANVPVENCLFYNELYEKYARR